MALSGIDLFVNSNADRIRCLAGPGTGKTKGLQRRVERLLLQDRVKGSKIFTVTFTRQAAAQLKADLGTIGIPSAELIHASTLHSYAFKILKQEEVIDALGRMPRPCTDFELTPFYHDLGEKLGGVRIARQQLKAFNAMWARLQSEVPGRARNPADIAFHAAYMDWMRFHQAMAIGELIPLTVRYLGENPRSEVYRAFDHIIVDEYQDLNRADQELVELIGRQSKIAIVGDDDQSIYSFRHANPEGIREWLPRQPDPKDDVELNTCWRCDGKILKLANCVIRNNPGRARGDLVPDKGREDAGEIAVVRWNTRAQETKGIAQGIAQLINTRRIPLDGKIIILVPRHDFSHHLNKELCALGITDVKIHGRFDWDDEELCKNWTLLTLLYNPRDRVSLRYWLGLPHKQWRRVEYERLRVACDLRHMSPDEILQDPGLCQELRIQSLKQRWDELSSELRNLAMLSEDAILEQLLPLRDATSRLGAIVRDLRAEGASGNLSELMLQALISPDEEPLSAKVNIMTYQGAKGLTCHTVIMTSLVNGILPKAPGTQPSMYGSDLEEQRRLFFVGLTRARHRVVLSSFVKVSSGENAKLSLGLTGSAYYLVAQPSQFINEMGPTAPCTQNGEDWLDSLK